MGIGVAVAGASGYAGGELLRLLAGHPEFEITAAMAHTHAGSAVASLHPHLVDLELRLTSSAATELAGAELVFLALPHAQAAAVARDLPAGVRVVDLGGGHRLREEADWRRYYDGPHEEAWTYGLPELPGQRAKITASTRVAGTGCYAVAATLALVPLLAAGLASPDDVVVVAASGTTGAGRTPAPHLLASEVMGAVTAYKVGAHQHTPEIKQATGVRTLTFLPMLAPMPRGILATVIAQPQHASGGDEDIRAALADAYRDEPFVRVLPPGRWPTTSGTSGSNACHLQATRDADSGRIVVVSAIDNLGKGAAGQAVQCANLMLGLPETSGLSTLAVRP